jgi:thiol-disulfide isomerase/thioredoxin
MPRRLPPFAIGCIALSGALLAAAGVAVAFGDDDVAAPPEPEVELSFDEDDDESGADDLIGGDVTGEEAPSTTFNLLDGGSMSLTDLRGTPIVVNFFASWCVPCIDEMPAFEEVHRELGDQVAFVGINLRDSVDAATDLVAETGVTYTVGRDPSGGIFQSFEAVNMPSTFLVSPDGVVVEGHAGALDADQLRTLIEAKLLR